jgi:aspartate aminotransferase-like enzyme
MQQLRVSGPTLCPQEVLQAMDKQMVNHRIGHLGWVIEADIKETLDAIDKALPKASA